MNDAPEAAIGRWEKQLGDLPGRAVVAWIIPGTDRRIEIRFNDGSDYPEFNLSSCWEMVLLGANVKYGEYGACCSTFESCDEFAKEYMRKHPNGTT